MVLQYASQIFKYTVDSEHILCDSNPLEHIRLVKSAKRDVCFYNEHQAKLFEMGIREYWSTSNQIPARFIILLRTGARIGEIAVLKWNDVNFKDMTLRFDAHIYSLSSKINAYYEGLKNHDKSRVLDIDNVLLGMLKSWQLEQSKSSLLNGHPINDDSFIFCLNIVTVKMANECFIKRYNKNYDEYLPCLNLRGFRYTHDTLLISDGMSLKKVADRLGHKDITITANIYAEVTPKAKKEVVERFSKILENCPLNEPQKSLRIIFLCVFKRWHNRFFWSLLIFVNTLIINLVQ
ncbi:tyrosine-type recombinase/integrase [Weissella kandleri]|uniref:tyrosine-type recombinase/integrase n=1 Tax=Weissella kandleri TaxID=1616 RepID=UPI00387E7F99